MFLCWSRWGNTDIIDQTCGMFIHDTPPPHPHTTGHIRAHAHIQLPTVHILLVILAPVAPIAGFFVVIHRIVLRIVLEALLQDRAILLEEHHVAKADVVPQRLDALRKPPVLPDVVAYHRQMRQRRIEHRR